MHNVSSYHCLTLLHDLSSISPSGLLCATASHLVCDRQVNSIGLGVSFSSPWGHVSLSFLFMKPIKLSRHPRQVLSDRYLQTYLPMAASSITGETLAATGIPKDSTSLTAVHVLLLTSSPHLGIISTWPHHCPGDITSNVTLHSGTA